MKWIIDICLLLLLCIVVAVNGQNDCAYLNFDWYLSQPNTELAANSDLFHLNEKTDEFTDGSIVEGKQL